MVSINIEIMKVMFTFDDFYDRTGDIKYQHEETQAMQTMKLGTGLKTMGTGSHVDENITRHDRK